MQDARRRNIDQALGLRLCTSQERRTKVETRGHNSRYGVIEEWKSWWLRQEKNYTQLLYHDSPTWSPHRFVLYPSQSEVLAQVAASCCGSSGKNYPPYLACAGTDFARPSPPCASSGHLLCDRSPRVVNQLLVLFLNFDFDLLLRRSSTLYGQTKSFQ